MEADHSELDDIQADLPTIGKRPSYLRMEKTAV
jgi:hypothetical protein